MVVVPTLAIFQNPCFNNNEIVNTKGGKKWQVEITVEEERSGKGKGGRGIKGVL